MANKKELQALIVLAGKIDPSLQKAIKSAENNTKGLNKEAGLIGKTMSKGFSIAAKAAAIGAAALGTALMYVAKKGLDLASDLNEVQNVVDVTFGKSASQIDEWAKTAKNQFGLSELAAKRYTGTLGAMLKSTGISNEHLVSMSQNLTGLTGDFASFYNLPHDEAFNKIKAGLSGETEPLKAIGINMSVANLEAYALSKGIKTAYSKMAEADKVILRYNYLLEASADAQNDFSRTADGYANQQRLLITNIQELSAKIMSKALPTFEKLFQKANKLMESFANNPEKIKKLQNAIESVFDKILNVVPTVISLITRLWQGIKFVLNIAYRLHNFIKGNWSIIEPLIYGIVAAMTAWKAITAGMAIYQGIMAGIRAGTVAATIAQWGLNAAVWANPMTWIIVGIVAAVGALVAAFYYLYKNWDSVSSYLSNSWIMIKRAFAKGINYIVDKLNWLIEKMNKIPGVEIPLIPKMDTSAYEAASNAQGDGTVKLKKYAIGGFADRPSIFGEAGPEAAIPLKRTPRSLSLLNQTARAIGADTGAGSAQFVFAPVISGGNTESIATQLKESADDFFDKCDRWWESKRRESFGVS